jgi:hypothetical protein
VQDAREAATLQMPHLDAIQKTLPRGAKPFTSRANNSASAPDPVVASRTVKDLELGMQFEDFGRHTLEGVADEWQLRKCVRGI